ncbi:hypothetical protein D3C71_2146470 [compost metagenome]
MQLCHSRVHGLASVLIRKSERTGLAVNAKPQFDLSRWNAIFLLRARDGTGVERHANAHDFARGASCCGCDRF